MQAWTADTIAMRLHELIGDDQPGEIGALRLHIVEVATEHFVRFGYRRANVGDIAREVGIGKGTLYLHFDSKRTLLLACTSLEKLRNLPRMQEALSAPLEERLGALMQVSLHNIMESPLSLRLLRGDKELERIVGGLGDSLKQDRARGRALMHEVLLGANPDLPADDLATLETVLPVLVMTAAHVLDAPSLMDDVTPEQFADLYARLLTAGVKGL